MPVGGTWNQALESELLPYLRFVNFKAVVTPKSNEKRSQTDGGQNSPYDRLL